VLTDEAVVEAIALQLRRGDRATVRVWGWSMFPALWPGTKVTLEACAYDELRLGDVAVVRHAHGLTIHRVVGGANGALAIIGSRQLQPDGIALTRENVLGRVRGIALGPAVLPAPGWAAARAGRWVDGGGPARVLADPLLRVRLRDWEARGLDATASLRRRWFDAPARLLDVDDIPAVREVLLARGIRPSARLMAAWAQMAAPDPPLPRAVVARRGAGPVRATARLAPAGADTVAVFDVWTSRSARRIGLATRVLEQALRHARDAGATRAILDARPERAGLYLRLGFRPTNEDSVPHHRRYERPLHPARGLS